MPGKTPAKAVAAFLEPLQTAVGCILHAKIVPSPGGRGRPNQDHRWVLNGPEGATLSGGQVLHAKMGYRIIEDADRGDPWRVTTTGYMYSFDDADGHELYAAHWHPSTPGDHKQPHLHFPEMVISPAGAFLAREPMQSGRVTLEGIIRMAIRNLLAEPLCEDWDNRLTLAEAPHHLYRSWHVKPDEPQKTPERP